MKLLLNIYWWSALWFVPASIIGLLGVKYDSQVLYIISAVWAVSFFLLGWVYQSIKSKPKNK
jgi:uncharacterized membrane protein